MPMPRVGSGPGAQQVPPKLDAPQPPAGLTAGARVGHSRTLGDLGEPPLVVHTHPGSQSVIHRLVTAVGVGRWCCGRQDALLPAELDDEPEAPEPDDPEPDDPEPEDPELAAPDELEPEADELEPEELDDDEVEPDEELDDELSELGTDAVPFELDRESVR